MVFDDEIKAMIQEGRHADAAERLWARGDAAGAAELYATIWDYARAVEVATEGGLLVDAYRHAITSKDRALEHKTLSDLLLDPVQASQAALLAQSKKRLSDAAHLAAAAGELTNAAQAFEDAGELFVAAELHERAGDQKAAGRLYERHLKDHEDDARAALALGRILLRFGRAEPAVQALQRIEKDPELGPSAQRLLVVAFDRLSLSDAAASVLDRLRAADASLPATVAAYLAAQQAQSSGPEAQLLLGRYQVKRTLGAGGAGRVLLVEDTFFSRDVAMKVLSAVEGARGRDALVRFAREARLSASLEHPNIVKVLDYYGQGPYLVMELMAGGTLDDRLFPRAAPKDGPLTPLAPAVARHVITSVLRALDAAHRRGVVHRDIKPGNVFFGAAGEVKLGDFGAAHLLDAGATRTGALIGTLAYMAPEQIASAAALHPATDLYAMGVLTYAVLLGSLPFPGPDFIEQHLSAAPRMPSSLAPGWLGVVEGSLAPLDALATQLLAKEPRDRPESALAVEHLLNALPWDAWQRSYETTPDRTVAQPTASRTSAPPPPSAPLLGRYQEYELDTFDPSLPRRARDELLQRDVELLRVSPAEHALLARFAAVSSPYLQGIFGEEEGLLVLESPAGVRMTGPIPLEVHAQLSGAVAALHAAGLTHGAIDRDTITLGTAHAVLRLPRAGLVSGTAEGDLEALARLRG
jgi:serine/threonine-protein kinase